MIRGKLGLDDEAYQGFLEESTRTKDGPGKKSTADMDNKELWRVVQAFKKRGFKLDEPHGDITKADDPQSTMIRHLWLVLKGYGELRNSSERALAQYARRITKVARLQWLKTKDAQKLIETLKKWVERVELRIIDDALNQGRLTLPMGFTCYQTFMNYPLLQMSEEQLQQAREFQQRVEAYLANYKPEKKAA